MASLDALEAMLRGGRDDALLRMSLGSTYLQAERPAEAAAHLARAVELDPDYSAAWKLLGRALAESGRKEEAAAAYERGIETAERRGDVQAVKEMRVFRKRLDRD